MSVRYKIVRQTPKYAVIKLDNVWHHYYVVDKDTYQKSPLIGRTELLSYIRNANATNAWNFNRICKIIIDQNILEWEGVLEFAKNNDIKIRMKKRYADRIR